MNFSKLFSCISLALMAAFATDSHAQYIEPSFRAQTGLLSVQFEGHDGDVLAFAGRDRTGIPRLGLLRAVGTEIEFREMQLPEGAVAIDAGAEQQPVLFILATSGVYRLDAFDGVPSRIASTTSVYRGRSLAELTSRLDFAQDVDGDDTTDLLIPDFDEFHVITSTGRRSLQLPSYRRSYDRNVSYRPESVTVAPDLAEGGALYAVRGKDLLSFAGDNPAPTASELALGLSDEIEREAFYNSYEDLDQNDIVVREIDRFDDINGDGLPDIVTLETISQGVFDKTTTYRIHHGHTRGGALGFDSDADTTLSSEGFQIGVRVAPLDEQRKILVTASVRVGVRAIIGALFSRSVTMRVEIYPATNDGTIASEPSTTIKSRVKFDFGTGQVEFPTIAFGDIDGDGINDLILKERNRAMRWRRGMPSGEFETESTDLGFTGPADGTNVTLADLDDDGRDEVVALYGRADGEPLAGQIGVFRDLQPDSQ